MDILILGAGDIGSQLAKRLTLEKHNITMIENDPKKAEYAREHLDVIVIEESGAFLETLENANIANMDVFAALSNNEILNLQTCRIAKKLGVSTTIARIRNPEYLKEDYILTKEELGVDFLIHPEKEAADAIIRLIRQSNATDIIEFEEGVIKLLGIRIENDSPVVHLALKELGQKFSGLPFNIVAIKRAQYTIIPKGEDLLLGGDQIFIIAREKDIKKSLQILGKNQSSINNLMLIGGGMISRFLLSNIDTNISIKVIEKDEIKAKFISEKFKEPLVILGDGSDLDLINFEGLTDMDAFVAITGDDETNIITSLVAKHLEVPRTITLIGKSNYLPLTPTIGLDAVISKQQMTVNSIQKFIRRGKVAHFAEIPGVDAEVIEFIAHEGNKICRKELAKQGFPEDAIVGAILKDGKNLVVPRGFTQIEPGDKVIIIALHRAISDVERYFK